MPVNTDVYWNLPDKNFFLASSGVEKGANSLDLDYATIAMLNIYLRNADNTKWTGLTATDTAWAVIDNNWDHSPLQSFLPASCTVDSTNGKISIAADLTVAGLGSALGTAASIGVNLQLRVISLGDTWPSRVITIPCTLNNALAVEVGTPGTNPELYVTVASLTAILAAYVLKVGATDIEITDATKGVIMPDANGVRYRHNLDVGGGMKGTSL